MVLYLDENLGRKLPLRVISSYCKLLQVISSYCKLFQVIVLVTRVSNSIFKYQHDQNYLIIVSFQKILSVRKEVKVASLVVG